MRFLLACLLVGCAHGSEVDVEEVPVVEVKKELPPSKPTPIQEELPEMTVKCHVKVYSENGCTVYSFRCEGLSTHEEVVCSPPPTWPWEMEPNPIIYDRSSM